MKNEASALTAKCSTAYSTANSSWMCGARPRREDNATCFDTAVGGSRSFEAPAALAGTIAVLAKRDMLWGREDIVEQAH